MTFSLAKSWEDRGLQIQTLKDRCIEILNRLNLPEEDARAQGMIHVRQLCNTLAAVPIKLQQNAEIRHNVPIIMNLLGLSRLEDLKSVLGDFNKNSKLGFVTSVQFALENCIELTLDAIPGEDSRGTFGNSSRRLIEVLGLTDPGVKHRTLMVPAWIRNTLHAAGIHKKASQTVILGGETYAFEKGKRVECASWSHVLYAFTCGMDIYEEILCSPTVTAVESINTAA